jgi:hypothetical protein
MGAVADAAPYALIVGIFLLGLLGLERVCDRYLWEQRCGWRELFEQS